MAELSSAARAADREWTRRSHGDRFAHHRRKLGDDRHLGCSLYELEPGKSAFPYHYHCANAEAIWVISGHGTARVNGGEIDLVPETWVSFPPGAGGAHEVRCTGTEPLRYLCVSTMVEPDICVYPDSDKIGVFVGAPPGGEADQRTVSGFWHRGAAVDYWEGEPAVGPDD